MTKRNTTKPVRVVSPIMEEQETSASTLQEWLDKEETVSDLLFSKGKEEGISNVSLIAFTQNDIGNAFWNTIGWNERQDLNYYDFVLNTENITAFNAQ